jgi:hypothetical protein
LLCLKISLLKNRDAPGRHLYQTIGVLLCDDKKNFCRIIEIQAKALIAHEAAPHVRWQKSKSCSSLQCTGKMKTMLKKNFREPQRISISGVQEKLSLVLEKIYLACRKKGNRELLF